VKPVDNGNARDLVFSVAGRPPAVQVLEVWILGTPDPWDCKSVPVKKGFHYSQVPFKTGFTLCVCNYNCSWMMKCS